MKYYISILLFSCITVFLNAETNALINDIPNKVCLDDQPEPFGHVTFYGELDLWWTESGALIIECNPPFFDECYTLIWDFNVTDQMTVILNDDNKTEISVTSGPDTTTGENGEQIHTFTR